MVQRGSPTPSPGGGGSRGGSGCGDGGSGGGGCGGGDSGGGCGGGGNGGGGFDGGGIGPRDTGNNASVGGNNFYSGSFELVSNAGFSEDLGLRWTVYSDYGALWGTDYPANVKGANDKDMRTSVGFGLLWDTAIGPLSFYWADAVNKKSYDRTRRFQFTIGTRL